MTFENAAEAAEFIKQKTDHRPRIAIVLGSGLGAFGDELNDAVAIPYEEIPHFVRSTVEGHAGRLVIGTSGGVPLIVQQGRFHYYEGYSMEQVMFPMRVFGRMGIEAVVLTNAAGSLKAGMRPGDLM
ncbi:MAG TPA: purine-nucleoside phosphorylase, partial [Blastocatellia bacterium]|nr:purine-nucleoside phosphorylase [Blastocatellia bacterium]